MGEISLRTFRGAGLAVALLAVPALAGAVQPGDAAPEWEVTSGSGEEIAVPAHADGAPAGLFFWGRWCPEGDAGMR